MPRAASRPWVRRTWWSPRRPTPWMSTSTFAPRWSRGGETLVTAAGPAGSTGRAASPTAGADAAGPGVGAAAVGTTAGAAVTAGEGTRTAAGTDGVAAAADRTGGEARGDGAGRPAPRRGLAATGSAGPAVDGRDATVDGETAACGVASRAAGEGKGAEDAAGGKAGASMGCRRRTTAVATLTASATSAKTSSGPERGAGPLRRARLVGVGEAGVERPPRAAGFAPLEPLAARASTRPSR